MSVSEKIRKISTLTFNIFLLSTPNLFVHEFSVINQHVNESSEVLTLLELESQIAEKIKFTSIIELEPI